MDKFKYKNLTVICNWKLLLPGFSSITLFGKVCTKKSIEIMKRFVRTYRGEVHMNHENIHILQEKKLPLKWLTYYIVYLYYFIICFICTFNWKLSYKTIPFEVEAYQCQEDFDYNESYWKDYIMSIKSRKKYYKLHYT